MPIAAQPENPMLAHKNLLEILTVSLLAAPLSASAAPGYCARLLPHFNPYDVGENGEVIGAAETAIGWEAAIWKDGTITRYGSLGGNSAVFTSLSSNGRLAGFSKLFGNRSAHAFVYENGIMRDITPGTKAGSVATGINASGELVGQFELNATTRPFVASQGRFIDLGTPGARYGSMSSINDAGTAVGWSETAPDANGSRGQYSFVYANGVKTILSAPGWYGIGVSRINNAGDIVGSGSGAGHGASAHAFLYARGVMHDIDTLGNEYSSGLDINERGQVVGDMIPIQGGRTRGFLYENGKMRDLNGSIRGMEGRMLDYAQSINNRGQIVGYACSDTVGCDFVLLEPTEGVCGSGTSAGTR
jgi:probable HAF family extracellular repeat protein